ncbi:MAG: hypothetical protein ABR992_05565 [Solirubrobacteraceae bacterium]
MEPPAYFEQANQLVMLGMELRWHYNPAKARRPPCVCCTKPIFGELDLTRRVR